MYFTLGGQTEFGLIFGYGDVDNLKHGLQPIGSEGMDDHSARGFSRFIQHNLIHMYNL